MMRRCGLSITVWGPLASGFLSGKYSHATLKDPKHRYGKMDYLPFDKERAFTLVDRLREMGASRGASVAQLAIAWLLAKRAVSSVIVSATRLDQLEDNLQAIDVTLTNSEVAALDAATPLAPVYPNWAIAMQNAELTSESLNRQ